MDLRNISRILWSFYVHLFVFSKINLTWTKCYRFIFLASRKVYLLRHLLSFTFLTLSNVFYGLLHIKEKQTIRFQMHSIPFCLRGPQDLRQNQENHQKLMLDGNLAVDSKAHLKVTFAVVVALARPSSNSSRRNERASALIWFQLQRLEAAQPTDCSMGEDARPAAAEGLRQTNGEMREQRRQETAGGTDGEKYDGGGGGGGAERERQQKQTQTSRVIEAACRSHVRRPAPPRKQQLVCS